MKKERIDIYNLKEIVDEFTTTFEETNNVFLFGSRAYKTSSLRSDIDLLILTEKPIPGIRIFEWITQNYPVVDIFKSNDNLTAESSANGSLISSKSDLVKKIKAIEIWNRYDGFKDNFTDWTQKIRSGVIIEPSYAKIPYNLYEAIKDFDQYIFDNGFPNTNLGIDWEIIGNRLNNKIEIAFELLIKWNSKSGTFNNVNLTNEKDFQNLCELIIKPWLPDMQRETTVATFDGQSKNIDFSIEMNKILIEAKHIKDPNTEAKVVKEIEGITKFYLSNTNVKLLLFWVLIDKGYDFDRALLEKTFTSRNTDTIVVAKVFHNVLS